MDEVQGLKEQSGPIWYNGTYVGFSSGGQPDSELVITSGNVGLYKEPNCVLSECGICGKIHHPHCEEE